MPSLNNSKPLSFCNTTASEKIKLFFTVDRNDVRFQRQAFINNQNRSSFTISDYRKLANVFITLYQCVLSPMGYPGEWKYWIDPATGRGSIGDKVKIENVEWIQLSVRQSDMKKEDVKVKKEDSDWLQGYGYQMWRSRHDSYRADGARGQFVIILPQYDAVIVTTADIGDMQAEINLIWKHLLPAFL